jgi:hypothetical protein
MGDSNQEIIQSKIPKADKNCTFFMKRKEYGWLGDRAGFFD